jgi:hypothetical protein
LILGPCCPSGTSPKSEEKLQQGRFQASSFSRKAHSVSPGLNQFNKLIYSQACLTDDGAQRTPVKRFVVRHNDLGKRVISAQDHVTALLPLEMKADFAQGFGTFPARDDRYTAHTATTNASNRSEGTGKWSSSRAAT